MFSCKSVLSLEHEPFESSHFWDRPSPSIAIRIDDEDASEYGDDEEADVPQVDIARY